MISSKYIEVRENGKAKLNWYEFLALPLGITISSVVYVYDATEISVLAYDFFKLGLILSGLFYIFIQRENDSTVLTLHVVLYCIVAYILPLSMEFFMSSIDSPLDYRVIVAGALGVFLFVFVFGGHPFISRRFDHHFLAYIHRQPYTISYSSPIRILRYLFAERWHLWELTYFSKLFLSLLFIIIIELSIMGGILTLI